MADAPAISGIALQISLLLFSSLVGFFIAATFATSILAPIAIKSLYSVRVFKKNVKIY